MRFITDFNCRTVETTVAMLLIDLENPRTFYSAADSSNSITLARQLVNKNNIPESKPAVTSAENINLFATYSTEYGERGP